MPVANREPKLPEPKPQVERAQGELNGMPPKTDLDVACEDKLEIITKREHLKEVEDAVDERIMEEMHKIGKNEHSVGGYTFTLYESEERIRCRAVRTKKLNLAD